ncbi:hypothetical protein EW146_g559 [Bondarzewia mesenterica]|uniref:PWWP domain-containing protein n=1 Tax=Bondarzewia mesenterica TaxID=1095465 RepID=A0A4S4M8G7_9AGAM|nr:hypothetical protein EW146_g559 [Bondarzewia mesenterica]
MASNDIPLSDILIPSRAAAKRARAAFGRQLSSSPEPDTPPKRKSTKRRKSAVSAVDSTKTVANFPTESAHSGPVSSEAIHPPAPLPRRPASHSRLPQSFTSSENEEEDSRWKCFNGQLVWVRIRRSGEPVWNETEESKEESFWWPGGILRGSLQRGPVHVLLFGRISPGAKTDISLPTPTESYILSMKTNNESLRFSAQNFRLPDVAPEIDEFPPKKVEDGAGREVPRGGRKNDFWKPPPPDPMLDVPGELVLSLEKKGRTEYWPAKVEEYIPPSKRTAKPRYRLLFLDDAMLSVERSMFYTTGEDGFYSCKLGKFDSGDSKIADNVDADIDESELTRGPSPIPEIPPPTNFGKLSIRQQFSYVKPVVKAVLNDRYPPAKDRHDAFMKGGIIRRALRKEAPGKGELNAREVTELGLVLNWWVLRDERYAKKLSSTWQASISVSDPPDDQAQAELSELSGRVQPTADSTNAAVISTHHQDARAQSVLSDLTDVVTPPPSEVTTCGEMLHSERTGHHEQERHRGCEAYEALTQLERIEYCQLVLLHESILQLLLWRSEERTSLKILDDNEEKHLHEIAFKMSEQMDWVVEIERLREAGQKRRQQKAGPPPMSMGGTRSRPKMSSSVRN